MSSIVSQEVKIDSIAALYQLIRSDQNEEIAEKVVDLFLKKEKQEFNICFAGHFSAGKSSMINYLLGEDILPQSPIPTSANVVKIMAGNPGAKVYFNHQQPIEYKDTYDLEMIKDYCKDGDSINRIELSTPTNVIKENVSLLDTPGIDSSNDADRVMTESSLHVVDVLFYVMDYNHVQSEVNLLFLQEMQKLNKPIYIVINQIDKHQQKELSLIQFKKNVEQALANWKIHPENIYYTSLIDKELPSNQIKTLHADLRTMMMDKDDKINSTLNNSINYLIEEHYCYLQEKDEDYKGCLKEKIHQLDTLIEDVRSIDEKRNKLEELLNVEETASKDLQTIVSTTLNNAYLMPAQLRDKAESFLNSQQKNFKLGLFSTKKKVNNEKARRLDDFYQSLIETVEATIDWKLREKLLDFINKYNINDSNNTELIQSFSVSYEKERLTELIKSGASINGGYLLVYTDDLSNDLKGRYKQRVRELKDDLITSLTDRNNQTRELINEQLEAYDKRNNLVLELNDIENKNKQKISDLKNIVAGHILFSIDLTTIRDATKTKKTVIPVTENQTSNPNLDQGVTSSKQPERLAQKQPSVPDVIQALEQTENYITDIKGMELIRNDIIQKRDRLKNRHYTVALFGAFSAGKSSFANALIGENILPVSPNPTTAAINKICPSDEQHPHGTVVVKFKSNGRLIDDINGILDGKVSLASLDEYINWFEANDQLDNSTVNHHLFLQAVYTGYKQLHQQLGEKVLITLDKFPDFVVKESIACFVEWIELYYDCPITEQGITLVDTPGADSINSRHTDVTFEYMKQSDAMLFVTYYNHAFSKADREFLTQLGRVKDAFSMDKMFFIVNAADLAKDETELNLVTNYVNERLQYFGINQPTIFPISSHLALAEKQGKRSDKSSGMNQFEKSFSKFLNEDLTAILAQASIYDINRVKQQLRNYLELAQKSKADKDRLLKEYKIEQEVIIDLINKIPVQHLINEIIEKAEKQIYYVEERMSIQFSDRFKESFNPSTIKSNGKEAKIELDQSLTQLIKEIGFQLEQELRAVCIRLETFINQKGMELNADIGKACDKYVSEKAVPSWENHPLKSPEISKTFEEQDRDHYKQSLAVFKNTKSFFEKNDKDIMKEKIQDTMRPIIKSYLTNNKNSILDNYLYQWEKLVQIRKKIIINSVKDYYKGLAYSLTGDIDINHLNKTIEKLDELNI